MPTLQKSSQKLLHKTTRKSSPSSFPISGEKKTGCWSTSRTEILNVFSFLPNNLNLPARWKKNKIFFLVVTDSFLPRTSNASIFAWLPKPIIKYPGAQTIHFGYQRFLFNQDDNARKKKTSSTFFTEKICEAPFAYPHSVCHDWQHWHLRRHKLTLFFGGV